MSLCRPKGRGGQRLTAEQSDQRCLVLWRADSRAFAYVIGRSFSPVRGLPFNALRRRMPQTCCRSFLQNENYTCNLCGSLAVIQRPDPISRSHFGPTYTQILFNYEGKLLVAADRHGIGCNSRRSVTRISQCVGVSGQKKNGEQSEMGQRG